MRNKIISLFSGAGGMDIGFKAAGFETVVAVEQDSACCETLRVNQPNVPILEGDISNFKTDTILKAASLAPLEAALVIGGPPCQSFSLAGQRMGLNDPRGMLLLEFVRVVREALPTAFVLENVKGMLNWQNGDAITAVKNEFLEPIIYEDKQYKYKIVHKVLNASDFGAPQNRERLFIVGSRIGLALDFPKPTHGTPDLIDTSLLPKVTTWDAIGTLPPADAPSATAMRVSQTIKGRIKKHGY